MFHCSVKFTVVRENRAIKVERGVRQLNRSLVRVEKELRKLRRGLRWLIRWL